MRKTWLPKLIRTTRRRSSFRLLLLVCSTGLAGSSTADSDGYYCAGEGYLAYQLRSALTPGVSGPQVLRVVRYSADGITLAGEIVLPDFQPHKLTCGNQEVRIGGWTGRPVEYVVDTSDVPKLAIEVSNPSQALQGSVMRNLGAWAQPGTVPLPSGEKGFSCRLVITSRVENTGAGLLHHIRTVVEVLNSEGSVTNSMELYAGTREETVD